MQKLLSSVIQTSNPSLIQKFIDKYLPREQSSLQRIYNDLQEYHPPVQSLEQHPVLVREITAKSVKKLDETPIQSCIRNSHSILSGLREKGIVLTDRDFQRGLQIVQKQKDRVMGPLKINPVAKYLKKGKINQLAKKYELNKEFYENPPVGFNFDDYAFDPEMLDYIEKRRKLLKSIQEKKLCEVEPQIKKPQKYKTIQSKVSSHPRRNSTPNPSFSTPHKISTPSPFPSLSSIKSSSKQIINRCNSFCRLKLTQKQQENYFGELQARLEKMDDVDIDSALRTKVKETTIHEKLDRYDLPYMSYLKQKPDFRAMGAIKKELLKDQIKMRGIVNFQD